MGRMSGLAVDMSAAALISVLMLNVAQADTAGFTAGKYAVSPTGAATYSIPIWAPQGPGGMQPQIALTYNSQRGTSYVGFGWSLSGLSSISRCSLTDAQDGAAGPVGLVISDGYCLDGQRLRLTGGTYGSGNSTYQTEIANFLDVQASGATGTVSGSTSGGGPAYWVVTAKNGWKYIYGGGGTTSNAAVPATTSSNSPIVSWQLSSVTDPRGNSMTITYSTNNTNAAAVPNVISWVPAGAGSATYNYTMNFIYTTDGSIHGYVGGVPVNNTNLLSSIVIAYKGTTLKTYNLTQSNNTTSTSRYLLTEIKECAGGGTSNCLAPTEITYQPGSAAISGPATLSGLSGTFSVVSTSLDFNGDGINDLLIANVASGTVAYSVAFGGPNGYGSPSPSIATGTGALLGDLDGSGVTSLVNKEGNNWVYYKWNKDTGTFVGTQGVAAVATAGQALVDLDGDGRADLIQAESDGFIHVALNTSTSDSVSFGPDINTLISGSVGLTERTTSTPELHFLGDSQNDVEEATRACTQYVKPGSPNCVKYNYIYYDWHLIGSTFVLDGGHNSDDNGNEVDYGDYNDDGCTDILTTTQLLFSACGGSDPKTVPLPSGFTVIGGMDWDGDGRRDALVYSSNSPLNGDVGVLLSTGTGLSATPIDTHIAYASGSRYVSAPNLSGDGQDGLVVSNATSIVYYLHGSPGVPPDLLKSITDGFGNFVKPTYSSLPYGNVYSISSPNPSADKSSYPDTSFFGPINVVQTSTFSDPSSSTGGTYVITNTYAGALSNRQGRGFDGFSEVTSLDGRSGILDTSDFLQVFPNTGMKYSDTLSLGTQTISVITNTLATPAVVLSTTANQQRYMPYFSDSVTQQYELGGAENGTLITTTHTTAALDTYGNATSVKQSSTDKDPNSPTKDQSWTKEITNTPFESTSPTYCANLLSQTQTVYTATVGDTVTLSKTPTPDPTYCDYTQIVTQPGTKYSVTEVPAYDSFGNISSDTITGYNMPARVVSTNWGDTGQFPAYVIDPSGAKTQYGYNSDGTLDNTKDPNGLSTFWHYDGFGHPTLETRPDGTSTQWNRSDCAASGGCLIGTHGLNVSRTEYAAGGGVVTDGTNYFDSVDRKIVSQSRLLASGAYQRTEQRYDSRGRITQTAVPCIWSDLMTPCTSWVTNLYDNLNRLTQTQTPSYAATVYAYSGRTTVVKDPNGHANSIVQGVDGTLRQITDANGYSISHGYDAAGGRTTTTDSLGRTLWSGNYDYGIKPFLVNSTDLSLGHRSYTAVDALGEVTLYNDLNGNSFSATYDASGRMTTRTEPDLFTQWTWGSDSTSYNVGKLQSVCTGPGTSATNTPVCTSSGYSESETYDGNARLSQRSIVIPTTNVAGGTYTYGYQYNASGQLGTLTYPSTIGAPLQLSYAYTNGVLSSVSDASNGVALWTANTANAAGQITEETLGNGVVINSSYDPVRLWLNSITAGVGGGAALENQSYLHDAVGNVTQRQENIHSITENFAYDALNRLCSSQLIQQGDGTSAGGTSTNLQLGYDGSSNNCDAPVAGPGAITSKTPDSISPVNYAATWTSYNYLSTFAAGVESVQFQYGPDRSRWQQVYTNSSTTETTTYIGSSLERVVNAGGVSYRAYVYAGGKPVAIQNRTASGTVWSYMLSDHQGSVASLLDSSGNSTVNESFTAYGVRRDPTTWSGAASNTDLATSAGITRQGYTFQTTLGQALGLNHMNGRVQDAVSGQFLSPDPNIPDPTNTQSYNRYAYTNNNPLSMVDPSGFDNKSCGVDSCPGGGFQDMPGERGSCYGNCSSGGYENSVYTSVPNPEYQAAVRTVLGSSPGFNTFQSALDSSALNDTSLFPQDSSLQDSFAQANSTSNGLTEVSLQSNGMPSVTVCSGANCPGHSRVPLVPATYPDGTGIVDMRTGGPLLIPRTVSLVNSARILGPYIKSVPPVVRGAMMVSLFRPNGTLDYQRTFSDNGNIVPDLIDAGYYQFGLVAAAAGYSLNEALAGAGAANLLGNGDKSGPFFTNGNFISNTEAAWNDYHMGKFNVVGP